MASRLLRRSGVACGLVAASLEWRPDFIFHVGVGMNHQEVDVLSQEWPGVEWRGFEPHPDIFESIVSTYPGTLHNVAVADFCGTAEITSRKRHLDGSSLFPGPDETGPKYKVSAVTLDSMYHPTFQKETLLWLDCEGCELKALKGAAKFIEGVDMVNVEMTATPPNPEQGSMVEIYDWLSSHGFFLQWVHTQRIYAGQVDGVFVRRELFRPKLCCIPQEITRYQTT